MFAQYRGNIPGFQWADQRCFHTQKTGNRNLLVGFLGWMAALKIKPVRSVNIAENNHEYSPVNIMKQEQNQSISWWKWSILMVADVATRRWTCNIKTHWRDSRWRTWFLTVHTWGRNPTESICRRTTRSPGTATTRGGDVLITRLDQELWLWGAFTSTLSTHISWCHCTAADDGAQRLKDSAPPVCSHQRWGPPEVPVRTPPGSSSFLSQQHNSNPTVHTAADGLCWLILLWLLCGCCLWF